ncbi:MAG: DUF423 domain-containing protein [Gammaproteobacteria bacterium]|nr:DUF423 domain-containing protein [Gammaproteobacteria bacterium]MXZ32133.1 DUF423 domain-containing protein [Gammaproteobacteria bacterium]MYE99405.1 DUF423 domain-containing protein [Gammaproteobacteria bacterium]MYG95332.1 DUF423 domain-containing protein [Gammaproteobacteria bacterium]
MNILLLLAAINGFLAVALGAFGAHGLSARLTADLMATYQTAVQYHFYHALALFGVALLSSQFPAAALPRASGYLFLAGIVLFSGSLYLLALTGARWLGAVAPVGGLGFLAGWLCLCIFAIGRQFQSG